MKEHLCCGAQSDLRVDCVHVQGMYEYLINESQAQGKCNKQAVA